MLYVGSRSNVELIIDVVRRALTLNRLLMLYVGLHCILELIISRNGGAPIRQSLHPRSEITVVTESLSGLYFTVQSRTPKHLWLYASGNERCTKA